MADVSSHSHIVPSTNEAKMIAQAFREAAAHFERNPLATPLDQYMPIEDCAQALCLAVSGARDELDDRQLAFMRRVGPAARALVTGDTRAR